LVLVDTSAWIDWSNNGTLASAIEVDRLLSMDRVATTELVLSELLQGAGAQDVFDRWIFRFEALHYYDSPRATWIRAAAMSFQLMRRGLTTALSDLVIAQVALDNDLAVYATDADFERVPGLRLHQVGS
jgi:predicted nucleic acid-binding protein